MAAKDKPAPDRDDLIARLRDCFSGQPDVVAAYLFGSQAAGTTRPESDVDTAVLLQQKSSGSVKIISIDRDELLAELRVIARRICSEHPEVKSARVFGSVARGDQVGTSDVDVMIVLDDGPQAGPLERIRSFYPYFDLPVGVDLLVYTQRQVDEHVAAGEPFLSKVWRESVALCP